MVFIPGISQKKLERRKGGGGGGRGSRGSSGGGNGGRTSPILSGGTSRTSSSTSSGGGPRTTIPQGQIFSGRTQGGGTRSDIYGNRSYLITADFKLEIYNVQSEYMEVGILALQELVLLDTGFRITTGLSFSAA